MSERMPDGYEKLPEGQRCRCVQLWQGPDGSFWCCGAGKAHAARQERIDASLAKRLGESVARNMVLVAVIKDTIEALERNSTGAPVVEILKAALDGAK